MLEEKFTKGEWRVTHFANGQMRIFRYGRDYKEPDIAITYGENDVANAHLIAAAPEMYNFLDDLLRNHDLGVDMDDEIEKLLAKARGESC